MIKVSTLYKIKKKLPAELKTYADMAIELYDLLNALHVRHYENDKIVGPAIGAEILILCYSAIFNLAKFLENAIKARKLIEPVLDELRDLSERALTVKTGTEKEFHYILYPMMFGTRILNMLYYSLYDIAYYGYTPVEAFIKRLIMFSPKARREAGFRIKTS